MNNHKQGSDMKLKNRIQGKQNQRVGVWAENMAERWLYSQGFHCIERIRTGWRIKWINGKVVSAKPKEKVSGDFNCIGKNGQYIHVEVKQRGSGKLFFSDLEEHQVEAMDERVKYGALVLLIWVQSPTELKALQWPIDGLKPGKSILWEQIK